VPEQKIIMIITTTTTTTAVAFDNIKAFFSIWTFVATLYPVSTIEMQLIK